MAVPRPARLSTLIVAVTLAVTGCSKGIPAMEGAAAIPPSKVNLSRGVELCRADHRALTYHVETVGVLEAEGQTEIAAGVSGVVDEVLFREGDEVGPDDPEPLIKIDQRRYISSLRVAEANEQRARVAVEQARDTLQRAEQARQGTSEQEKRQASLALNAAVAELAAAVANRELAAYNLQRSQVRAPYRGRINARRVTPGTYLEDKSVVATMADLSRLRLTGFVPETAALTVRAHLTEQQTIDRAARIGVPIAAGLAGFDPWSALTGSAWAYHSGPLNLTSAFDPEFTVLAFPQRIFRAKVFFLSTVADPATHMFECKAEVDVPPEVDLRPGFTARIRFPLQSNPDACVIPEEAVRATEHGFVAFEPFRRTGKNGTSEWAARLVRLELGFRSPGWVEVKAGLSPGQWLVRRGAEALDDGSLLRIPEAQVAQMEAEPASSPAVAAGPRTLGTLGR